MAIPVLLFEFSRRRRDLPFRWIFWVFGAFIVGCGLTHLMEVVTMYVPMYRFSAIVKLATALISLATVAVLVPLLPKARNLRGARELEEEIQERRWISELLRQSEERFRLLVEGTTDYAIFVLDTKGHVVSWNAGAERIFGYRADDIIGQHFSRFYTQESIKISWPDQELAHAADEGRFEDEGWRVRKDGSRYWANVIFTALRDDAGNLVGFSKITRDISERKEAQAKLEQFAEQLKRSNRELEQFATVASHDLQEPLRKIQTFSDRIRVRCAEALDTNSRDYLERMQNAATRMRTLINDLLTFSLVTSKKRQFELVDLGQVARDVVSDLDERLQQSGGRIEVANLPTVEADPTQMRQLLQNLLSNALKFHRADVPPFIRVDGKVFVGVDRPYCDTGRPSAPLCQISVQDNGIGFEEKYLDRIFEVFQRLHGRHEYEGTGMGLAICRKIVERHGGYITAQSELGQGATFVVTLPMHQPREEEPYEKKTEVHHGVDG